MSKDTSGLRWTSVDSLVADSITSQCSTSLIREKKQWVKLWTSVKNLISHDKISYHQVAKLSSLSNLLKEGWSSNLPRLDRLVSMKSSSTPWLQNRDCIGVPILKMLQQKSKSIVNMKSILSIFLEPSKGITKLQLKFIVDPMPLLLLWHIAASPAGCLAVIKVWRNW